MSVAKGTAIYVYDSNGTLVNTFSSGRKAAEHFDCSHPTIFKYLPGRPATVARAGFYE
jgi:hypothetical protein